MRGLPLSHMRSVRIMEDIKVTLYSLVLLVIALGFIIGTLIFAPAVTVAFATLASLTYIAGMVVTTVRG